ncbi:MAG: hypothetical protein IJ251_01010 [Oscillospiraceae bacterium]|nr:hypothetical protein [Oscillospiraceae bacterium]
MRTRKRKIFKPHRGYRIRRKNENAVKIVGGVLLVAVLVFVGYSAMEPLTEYMNRNRETETVTEELPTETLPSETEASVTETDTATELSELPVNKTVSMGKTVFLDESATESEIMLISAVDRAKTDGAAAVVIPMKTEGGIYRYKTSNKTAATSITDPVRSELTAEDIAKTVTDRGLIPCAYVSVLTDNNRYGDTRTGAYHSPDGMPWIDADPAKGGKPWISPFSDEAALMLCEMCTEIADAGFAQIICDDFVFPEFTERDMEILGEEVGDEQARQKAVMTLIKRMTNSARSAGADVLVRIPVRDVIGETGLMDAEKLSGCSLLVDMGDTSRITKVNGNDLSPLDTAHKTSALYVAYTAHTQGLVSYPMIISSDDNDLIAEALYEVDCDSFYLY